MYKSCNYWTCIPLWKLRVFQYNWGGIVNWYDSYKSSNCWNCMSLWTLIVKQCNYPERAQSKSCTTHSSHTTGETVYHYGHLKFFSAIQLSQRGLVKTVSHATCKTVSHYGHRFFRTIIRKGPSQLVRLIQLLLDWWNLISLWTLKVF